MTAYVTITKKEDMTMNLSEKFLWGGATTAHQSEGAYYECGKSPAVCDFFPQAIHSDFKYGIDSFHKFEEDFALLEELGFTCFRFSIDWSRVMPDGENFSEQGLQFYDNYINSIINHGMEPICSLYHFEMPQCLMQKYNGFYSRTVVNKFIEYANVVIDRYGDRVKKWITFNEQNGFALKIDKRGYGAVCPKGLNQEIFTNQLIHHSLVAHAKVVEKIHTIKDAIVLGMVIYIPYYPATCRPDDYLTAMEEMNKTNIFLDVFAYGKYPEYQWARMKKRNTMPIIEDDDLELMKNNTVDWIAFSYYMSSTASIETDKNNQTMNINLQPNPYLKETKWGWTIDPIGLRVALRELQEKYHLPLIIVENGFGSEDIFENNTVIDNERISYMKNHINQMQIAIDEGVDCRGYLMWAPIDILSSTGEMAKRYGVIYVNRDDKDLKDMQRFKKKSFDWYKKVIATHGEDLENI